MDMNVAQLLREPIGATRDFQVDETIDVTGEGQKNRVQGNCNMLRTQRSILVKCTLDTALELSCNRCLSKFQYPIKIKFEEEFLPTVDVQSGAPLAPPEDPGAFTIDERHILDITEAIRQYALLAIPMKALCKKDCAGLCATCGKNLNQGQCDCPKDNTDPRWSKLADFR